MGVGVSGSVCAFTAACVVSAGRRNPEPTGQQNIENKAKCHVYQRLKLELVMLLIMSRCESMCIFSIACTSIYFLMVLCIYSNLNQRS